MIQATDPRSHKWIAINWRTEKMICYSKTLRDCIHQAHKKGFSGEDFYTTFSVPGDFRK